MDGINDFATFGLDAQQVVIHDVKGHVVFKATKDSGSAIVWNCRDESDRIVESGVYIAKITKSDGSTLYQSFAVVK